MDMIDAVEITNLHKSIDGQPVLRGLTLRIPAGTVYGLVGPSGSGKTTLFNLLLGFLQAERGTIKVLGSSNLEHNRMRIGHVLQSQLSYPQFTAREYLHFLGELRGMRGPQLGERVAAELQVVGIAALADQSIQRLSQPQRQRLALAQALLAQPALLLLDDPTAGAEDHMAHELLDLLANLRDRGQTIILATRQLAEAEYICDQIGILVEGQLVTEASTRSLRGPGRNALITVTALPPSTAQQLQALSPAITCEGAEIALQPNSAELQAQVLQALIAAGVEVIALEPFGRPIEDLYLRALHGQPIQVPEPALPAPAPVQSAPPPAVPVVPPEPAPAPLRGTGETLLRELLKQEDQRPQ